MTSPDTLKALAERLRTSYGLNRIPVSEEAAALLESLASADEGVPSVRRWYRGSDGMVINAAGDWVLYDDHLAALSAQSTAADEMAVALRDLHDVMRESMGSGGWVPSPLHSSFMHAMVDAQAALAAHEAKHGGKG